MDLIINRFAEFYFCTSGRKGGREGGKIFIPCFM